MSEESAWISLRLADGEYYPVFRHGDPVSRHLSLVPASPSQNEIAIGFYLHPENGPEPLSIGVLRFTDLPSDADEIELNLDVSLENSGTLQVAVSDPVSGRSRREEFNLPDPDGTSHSRPGTDRNRRPGVIAAAAFVLAGLILVFWLTWMVTGWGRQDAPPAPVSVVVDGYYPV